MRIAPDDLANAEAVAACANSGTVVGTVASASYIPALVALSQEAAMVGFPCTIVQTYEAFTTAKAKRVLRGQDLSYVRALSLPASPLLPRTIWCDANTASHISTQRHGWRVSHLYRARMWRAVLENGHHLLAVDLDWSFLDMRRVPLKPAGTILRALEAMRTVKDEPPDIVALHDGPTRLLLNVGCMLVRSTPGTVALAKRVENRTRGAWDQAIFNEELNFASEHKVSCCHTEPGTPCDLGSFLRIRPTVHNMGHEVKTVQERRDVEGPEQCSDDQPASAQPPPRSTFEWSFRKPSDPIGRFSGKGWEPRSSFNELHGRRPGRCTALGNVCRCRRPDPSEVEDDDAFRTRDAERLMRYLLSSKESANKAVNSSAFHLGMEFGWPPRHDLRDPSHDPGRPILLRDWLRPFISPKEYASILRAQWQREESRSTT